jgi:HK97 family phage major capsid protein
MSEASAKETMRKLAAKAAEVYADETKSVGDKLTEMDAIEADLKKASDEVSLHVKAKMLAGGGEASEEARSVEKVDVGAKTVGRQVIESEAFANTLRQINGGSVEGRFSFTSEIGTKVAATVDEGVTIANGQLNGAGGVLALPDYLPGIVDIRFAQLSVSELFAQGATTSPIVSYVKEATETQGAAARAEKAALAQSDATFARVNEQVGSIGAYFSLTGEMLEDSAQTESFLTNRLIAQLARERENETLNGSGYPALAGILGRSGLTTAISAGTTGTLAAPMKLAEAIFQQRTAIRTTAFVEPDAVVMNPTDWQYIQLAKDANTQYYAGGPFSGAYGNGGYSNVAALWGLRVVLSPRIASGVALVGGFNECGQLFNRQGVVVEMTNSDSTDFQNNLIKVRAISRAALAVYRPGGFGKVTITWA